MDMLIGKDGLMLKKLVAEDADWVMDMLRFLFDKVAGDIHVQSCIAMVLSQVSLQLGRFETAIKWAVTAETIKPENISTILNLGDTTS